MLELGKYFVRVLHPSVASADDCRRFHFRDPARLKTRLVIPGGPLLQILEDFFKSRFTCGETFNFMQGLYLHKDYVNVKKFVAWRGKRVCMYLGYNIVCYDSGTIDVTEHK